MIFNSKLILFFRWTLHSFKKMILCDINILNLTLVSGINISPDLVILRIFQILVSPIIELIQICKITKHLFWSKNKVFLAIFLCFPSIITEKSFSISTCGRFTLFTKINSPLLLLSIYFDHPFSVFFIH